MTTINDETTYAQRTPADGERAFGWTPDDGSGDPKAANYLWEAVREYVQRGGRWISDAGRRFILEAGDAVGLSGAPGIALLTTTADAPLPPDGTSTDFATGFVFGPQPGDGLGTTIVATDGDYTKTALLVVSVAEGATSIALAADTVTVNGAAVATGVPQIASVVARNGRNVNTASATVFDGWGGEEETLINTVTGGSLASTGFTAPAGTYAVSITGAVTNAGGGEADVRIAVTVDGTPPDEPVPVVVRTEDGEDGSFSIPEAVVVLDDTAVIGFNHTSLSGTTDLDTTAVMMTIRRLN